MKTLTAALVAAFTQMATDAMSAIGGIVPVVLPVLAAIIVVGIAIKVVRRIVGR